MDEQAVREHAQAHADALLAGRLQPWGAGSEGPAASSNTHPRAVTVRL